MNVKVHLSASCVLAALLCSCAATSIKKTWKASEGRMPVTRIAVIAVEDRGILRQGLENRLRAELAKAGAKPLTTFELLSLYQIKEDKNAAVQSFRATGAEALLIMRLVDKSSAYREFQAGNERYAPVVTGSSAIGWYDYYTVGFMAMSSSYGSLREKVYLEVSLHDLTTEQRLWSALTQTMVGENMDRLAEMDKLVAKVVAAMKKDGVVP
jgi:hypothetical protein